MLFAAGGDDEYGVIRSDVLRRVHPMRQLPPRRADRSWPRSRCTGRSPGPELLYFRRDHPGAGTEPAHPGAVRRRLDPDGPASRRRGCYGEYVLGYVGAIRRAPLSSRDRLLCYRHLLRWLAGRAGRLLAR